MAAKSLFQKEPMNESVWKSIWKIVATECNFYKVVDFSLQSYENCALPYMFP